MIYVGTTKGPFLRSEDIMVSGNFVKRMWAFGILLFIYDMSTWMESFWIFMWNVAFYDIKWIVSNFSVLWSIFHFSGNLCLTCSLIKSLFLLLWGSASETFGLVFEKWSKFPVLPYMVPSSLRKTPFKVHDIYVINIG